MKNFKRTTVCLAMLMTCFTMIAQRSTITMKGRGSVGMCGFPCTLTVKPDGSGVIKGEATKEVSAVTINFRHHSYVLFYQPTAKGGKGITGDGFQWGYIRDITVNPFTVKGTSFKPTTDKRKPTFVGTTDKSQAKFSVIVPYTIDNKGYTNEIEFVFKIENAKVTTGKEGNASTSKPETKNEKHAPASLGISAGEKTITIP